MNDLLRAVLFLPPQSSSAALEVDVLHYTVISATMLGATAVFALATFWLVRFRRRTGDGLAPTPRVLMPPRLEVGLIVGTLGLFLVWWAVGFHQFARQESPPDDAIRVHVTAKQWMWKFAYPEGGSSINTLTVPVGQPVHLVMTSRDVIHSFFVPAFRLKQDVVPGTYLSLWFEATEPGTFPVYCAEYCGLEHSRMRAVVVALEPDAYAAWSRDRRQAPLHDMPSERMPDEGGGGDMVTEGLEAASRNGCLACHTLDGQPHIGPTWAGLYRSTRSFTHGEPVTADEAYLTRSMMDPLAEVVAGFQPVMPTYQGALTHAEVGAIVELIRSLRDVSPTPAVTLPATEVQGPAALPTEDTGETGEEAP